MRRVLVIQGQMKQYRVPFFEKLAVALRRDDIALKVAYSDPPEFGNKTDSCDLPPGLGLKVSGLWMSGGRALYQPLLPEVIDADLVIAEQANKHLLNYLLIAVSVLGLRRVAFWGLGENRSGNRSEKSEWLRRQIVNKVDWWFAYTRSTRKYLLSNGVPSDRITVVQNAVDTSEFSRLIHSISDAVLNVTKERFHIRPDSPIGLFCGVLSPDKGIKFLLEAAEEIKSRLPHFHLFVIGGGPERQTLERHEATHSWIHYVGPKFGQEKALFFRIADVFLLPGRVGLAILDAFAAGLPLLTTDVPYQGPEVEYLENSVNGMMTENDIHAYASECVSLLANQSTLQKFSLAASESSQKYSIEAMVENFCAGIRGCFEIGQQRSVSVTAY